MLEIGINTYVDVDFVDDFVFTFYEGDVKNYWNSLNENQKMYYIMHSFAIMDSQKYIGKRMYTEQETEFPRISRLETQFDGINDPDELDELFQIAQAEILVSILDVQGTGHGGMALIAKLKQGLVSFSLDGFSESYSNSVRPEELALISPKAHMLLRKWLHGSFSVL